MLSSIVKEATTFEMELRGHKQATAHSHEHTKNSNPSKKKFSQRQNSNSNQVINSKTPRNRLIYVGRHGKWSTSSSTSCNFQICFCKRRDLRLNITYRALHQAIALRIARALLKINLDAMKSRQASRHPASSTALPTSQTT